MKDLPEILPDTISAVSAEAGQCMAILENSAALPVYP